jgi:ubiquinol-cytochrome c reductase cytochrome b subunit
MGYVLPWGQMSQHGANVITNILGAIPVVGETIKTYLLGGPAVGDPTLNRFFSLHYLLPFVIAGIVILHIWAFHQVGNGNPTGVPIQDVKKDAVPFHPYYTVKDGFAIVLYLILFAAFVFYFPNALGHADNSIEANPLVTPAHIVPEWYLLPFYAILRAFVFDIGPITAKLLGVIAMFGSIAMLFLLPWLDTSKVRSMRYRPFAQQIFVLFVLSCVGLGFCGANDPDKLIFKFREDQIAVTYADANGQQKSEVFDDFAPVQARMASLPATAGAAMEVRASGFKWLWLSWILTAFYFAYFLIFMPLLGIIEKPKPRPASIADSVHKRSRQMASSVNPAATPAE